MPTQWNSAAAAIVTSASRSVMPWSATIAGVMPRRNSRRARGVADHELTLDAARLGALLRPPVPRVVALELPGVRVVGQRALEGVEQVVAKDRMVDWGDQLDARVEIAGHEVGRADVDLHVAVALEGEDPGVLEVAADDRDDSDVVRYPGDARNQ